MITWLQDTFGKHHRTLLGALLVVIIGSFVFYGYSNNARGPGSSDSLRHTTAAGIIDLTDIRTTLEARELAALRTFAGSADDFLTAAKIAAFNVKHGGGAIDPRQDQLLTHYVDIAERLAAADAIGIPRPGEKELTEHIRTHRYFKGADDKFDPAAVRMVSQAAHDRLNLNEARLQVALANDWRITRLADALLPDDAPALDALAARASETMRAKWTVTRALYPREGYTAVIPPDDRALAAHFERVKENHRIPKRVKLRYARIPGASDAAAGKPTDDDLVALAARRKDLYPLFGTVSNTTFLIDFRTALEAHWRKEKAGENAAAKTSESLGATMPLGNTRPDNAAVDAMIKAAGFKTVAVPAYGADNIPKVEGIPAALLERALDLTPQRWRTAAIPYDDAAYVFILDEEIPSRLPELAEVRRQVEADRVKVETERRFAETAKAKAAELAAAVQSGKPFGEAAVAAGFTLVDTPDFDLRSVPDELRSAIETLRVIPQGGVSPALPSDRGMQVIRIVSRTVPPLDNKTDDLAATFRRRLGAAAARSSLRSLPGLGD